MISKVIQMKAVCVGSVSSDFFKSKLNKIPKQISERVESDLVGFSISRLNEIIQENKKKFFFKKKETMEVARAEVLSEFDVLGVHRCIYEQEFRQYQSFVLNIDDGSNVKFEELQNALSFLKKMSLITNEEIKAFTDNALKTESLETI